MDAVGVSGAALTTGFNSVFNYDNIAIVIEFVIIVMQQILIFTLLRGLFKMKDVLNSLLNAITILNERLRHHGGDDNDAKS